MATKWKNTTEKIKTGFHKERTQKILGSIFGIFGILVLGVLIKYQVYYITTTSMMIGVVGNISLCAGLCFLSEPYLRWKYEKIAEEDYETWQQKRKGSYRNLYIAGIIGAVLSMFYMWGIMNFYNLYWGHNYSAGYVMMLTVLIQFIIAQILLKKFWARRLDQMMARMEEMNQKRIAEALEIEKKSLEKVSRSDQLRVDLITNVSHDLKTPLTSMVGYLELIKKEELSEIVRDYVEVISARAEKLGEMINSLFNLAKASSGNVEFHKENC